MIDCVDPSPVAGAKIDVKDGATAQKVDAASSTTSKVKELGSLAAGSAPAATVKAGSSPTKTSGDALKVEEGAPMTGKAPASSSSPSMTEGEVAGGLKVGAAGATTTVDVQVSTTSTVVGKVDLPSSASQDIPSKEVVSSDATAPTPASAATKATIPVKDVVMPSGAEAAISTPGVHTTVVPPDKQTVPPRVVQPRKRSGGSVDMMIRKIENRGPGAGSVPDLHIGGSSTTAVDVQKPEVSNGWRWLVKQAVFDSEARDGLTIQFPPCVGVW